MLAALPEEVAVTKSALKRNLVAVAFSSTDREVHRCWDTTHPPDKSTDITAVRHPPSIRVPCSHCIAGPLQASMHCWDPVFLGMGHCISERFVLKAV